MILIPEAHDALADAVTGRRKGARGARRLLPRWSRRATGGTAVAVVVVSGVALAATTGWHPVLGGANRGVPRPFEARRPVPDAQLHALAVLRRPQLDADRAPEVGAALRLFRRPDVDGVHVDGIRVLRRHPDAIMLLVPVERSGSAVARDRFPLQRDVLCLIRVAPSHSRFAPDHRSAASARTRVVSTSLHCGDLRELQRTGILIGDERRIAGVVPDGVARVVVRTARHGRVSANVRDNYYEVPSDPTLVAPGPTEWLDVAGRVVASFDAGRS